MSLEHPTPQLESIVNAVSERFHIANSATYRRSMISGHWFIVSMYSALQWCHIRCIYRLKCTGVFDSMYSDLDQESTSQILSILKHEGKFVKFHMIPVQRQVGENRMRSICNCVCCGFKFWSQPY